MPCVAIVLFLFTINTLWAADSGDIEKIEFSPQNADINLTVKDRDRKIHQYSLHSKVLQKSRYFRINFGLANLDTKALPLIKTYNVCSKYVFDQVVAFLYENPVYINNFNEAFELLFTQDQLEIEQFDEYLFKIMSEEKFLEKLHEQELINMLQFMYRSQRPSANLLYERILEFIGSNKNLCTGCFRKKLSLYPKVNVEFKQKIEAALLANEQPEPKLLEEVPSTTKVSKKKKKSS
jgi:hypothetical protein